MTNNDPTAAAIRAELTGDGDRDATTEVRDLIYRHLSGQADTPAADTGSITPDVAALALNSDTLKRTILAALSDPSPKGN
jgi:hypothetical protein